MKERLLFQVDLNVSMMKTRFIKDNESESNRLRLVALRFLSTEEKNLHLEFKRIRL